MLDKYAAFIKAHERIAAILGILLLALYFGNKLIDLSAKRADAADLAAQKGLAATVAQNADLKASFDKAVQSLTDLTSRVVAENKGLQNAVAARTSATQKQQQLDTTRPVSELVGRWQGLVMLRPEDVKVAPEGVLVNEFGARKTVSLLEEVPTLRQNYAAVQKMYDNSQSLFKEQSGVLNACAAQVSGLQKQTVDQDAACKAQVNKIKADDRKSKRNWFVRGLVVGGGGVAILYGAHKAGAF